MKNTTDRIHFYGEVGMSPREISDTLGVPLSRVYRTLKFSRTGRRTLHYFPNMDTSKNQLNTAEHNRNYVVDHLHPSKNENNRIPPHLESPY